MCMWVWGCVQVPVFYHLPVLIIHLPQVVPRQDTFDSLQRKKKGVSIADPTVIFGHLNIAPKSPANLDESSEFTRCLTPEEIYKLNQRHKPPTPTERLKLFSFTKRHLRLPFRSKAKKKELSLGLQRSSSEGKKEIKIAMSPLWGQRARKATPSPPPLAPQPAVEKEKVTGK